MKGRDRHHAKRPKARGVPESDVAARLTAKLQAAVDAHRRGDFEQAESGYRQVLAQAKRQPDALHLLGVLMLQRGDAVEAERLIREAISSSPKVADYHDNLGSALMALGRAETAMLAHAAAIRLRPDFAQARFNLGNVLAEQGDHRRAVAAFSSAVALSPAYAKAWYNLGNALRALTWYGGAASALGHCVALTPGMVGAHTNYGDALCAVGRLVEGLEQQRIALSLAPNDATQHYNLGVVLQQMNRLEEAELVYRAALRHQPNHAGALNNLGSVLRRLNQPLRAIQCHRMALVFLPDFPEAYFNLGNAMQKLGRFREAADIYRKVLGRSPEFAAATHNMALISLMSGDLEHGWRGYETRFATKEAKPDRHPPIPRWKGEPLNGRRLLIWREQGVGDELMLASCLGELRSLDGGVTMEVDSRLVSLFGRSFPWAEVRPESCDADGNETLENIGADVHIPMASLPRLLRGRLSAFPSTASRLKPDPALLARWRTRVGALGRGLKVGICWRSQLTGDGREAAYTDLAEWLPLLELDGVRVVSLQYDDSHAEEEALRNATGRAPHVWADLDLKNDFEATAALVANLDLVVTVATSSGELAGALGVPVWRMGNALGDWSALGTGCRPWFPTMRLWRPRHGERVGTIIGRVARELATLSVAPPVIRSPTAPTPTNATEPSAEIALKHALAHHRGGRLAPALEAYRETLAIDPANADALHLMGLIHHQTGGDPDAVSALRRALRVDPVFPFAFNNLGLVLQAMGDVRRAGSAFGRALALSPAFPEAASHLGVHAQMAHRYVPAANWHFRAVRLDPASANFRNNLGTTLERMSRFDEADRAYRVGAALDPTSSPDLLNNLGTMARLNGDLKSAYRWVGRALAVAPGYALAAWNRGLLALRWGDLETGWAGYERRFQAPQLQPPRAIRLPLWRGEPLGGRRLLVWAEQGVGDEMMFASRLGPLERADGTVVLEVDHRLVDMMARAFPWAEVRATAGRPGGPEERDPSDCDLQLPLGSIPARLIGRLADFADTTPGYLSPTPERRALWRERVNALPAGLHVGIAWRSQVTDAYRTSAYTTLPDWLPVLRVPGVQGVTLQHGDCAAELAALRDAHGLSLHRWEDLDLRDDFEGVAALIANLDLVICPATSVGELAGSLGVPTWRLCGPDWTLLGAATRPWYPTMRVVHPQSGESVKDIPRRVAVMLRHLMAARAYRND